MTWSPFRQRTKPEARADAEGFLRAQNIQFPNGPTTVFEGLGGEAVIHSHTVTETTPFWRRVANARPPPGTLAAKAKSIRAQTLIPCFPRIPCYAQGQRRCCDEQVTYADPAVRELSEPVQVEWTKFQWCHVPWIMRGAVRMRLSNTSKEGKRIVTTRCRCAGGNESTQSSPVAGSADITADQDTTADTDEPALHERFLNWFGHHWGQLKSSYYLEAQGEFYVQGWDLIKQFYHIFIERHVRVKVHAVVKARVTFLGKTIERTFTHDISATLPIAKLDHDC